jgi:hypothetical protein
MLGRTDPHPKGKPTLILSLSKDTGPSIGLSAASKKEATREREHRYAQDQ